VLLQVSHLHRLSILEPFHRCWPAFERCQSTECALSTQGVQHTTGRVCGCAVMGCWANVAHPSGVSCRLCNMQHMALAMHASTRDGTLGIASYTTAVEYCTMCSHTIPRVLTQLLTYLLSRSLRRQGPAADLCPWRHCPGQLHHHHCEGALQGAAPRRELHRYCEQSDDKLRLWCSMHSRGEHCTSGGAVVAGHGRACGCTPAFTSMRMFMFGSYIQSLGYM
jgi:hypothetical protein